MHNPMPQELGASMVVGLGARSPTPGAGCHADHRSPSCALAGGGHWAELAAKAASLAAEGQRAAPRAVLVTASP